MKIISALKAVAVAEMAWKKERAEVSPAAPSLLAAIENARRDWQQALREMDQVDSELAEYVIYKINAAERRFMALLEQAKKEGVTAWPNATDFFYAPIKSGDRELPGLP